MLSNLGIVTPNRNGQLVPPGHILVAEKLRGSSLVKSLLAVATVTFSSELENCGVDFCPSSGSAVIYFSASRLENWTDEKEKILKLRKAFPIRGIVIADRTPSTQVHFSQLQHLVVGELGMEICPVLSSDEVPQILTAVLNCETRNQSNPFRPKQSVVSNDMLLRSICTIPKLGEKRAQLLLEKFGNIKNISVATVEDLCQVVGMQSAISVLAFFSDPIMETPKE